jgi:hypothetical protein
VQTAKRLKAANFPKLQTKGTLPEDFWQWPLAKQEAWLMEFIRDAARSKGKKMNAISEERLLQVHPVLRVRVQQMLGLLAEQGLNVIVTQGFRTYAEQQAIYNQGRTTPGQIVSNALPGQSWHNFGLAVDLAPVGVVNGKMVVDWNQNHPDWQKMLSAGSFYKLAEGAQWRTFKDWPHFYPVEIPANPPDIVRALYAERGINAVSEWFEKILGPAVTPVSQADGTAAGD